MERFLERSGIKYDQISKSIKNLASSRDTLEIYFNKIYEDTVRKKRDKIIINLKKFKKLNLEMKMRVFKKSIKDFTNTYYAPRSKKIVNLVKQINVNSHIRLTLGGCFIIKDQNHIILEKEPKKQ